MKTKILSRREKEEKVQDLEDKLTRVSELEAKVRVIETRLKILNLVSDNVKEKPTMD